MPFDNPHQAPFSNDEVLRDARRRISNENDWAQGRFRDGDRHCLVAALSVVSGSRNFNMPNPVERRLARLLVAQLPARKRIWARLRFFTARQRLMWFNDDPRTSHADVMALFDRTIDNLASKMPVYVSGDRGF